MIAINQGRAFLPSSAWALAIILAYGLISTQGANAEPPMEARLKEPLTVTLGSHPISLPAGTLVQVLQRTDGKAIINLKLQDGSSIITRVSLSALDLTPTTPKSTEVAGASNPVDAKPGVPPASPTDEAPSPAGTNSQPVSPATTIPIDSTTANTLLTSPTTPANGSEEVPPPVADFTSLLSRLGEPIQVEQPDFPEPDPRFQFKQLSISISDHPEIDGRITIIYTIPLDKDAKPGPRAHHIVFYCPWYREAKPLDEKICKFLSGNLGLTVVSLQINWDAAAKATPAKPAAIAADATNIDLNVPPPQGTKPAESLTGGLYTRQDVYAQIAFEAQGLLEAKYGLKHEPLIVIGLSTGSDLAERMALHHQDKMAGVVLMSGGDFEIPSAKLNVPCLVMYSRGDTNGSANDDLLSSLQTLGSRPFNLVIEPQWDNYNWEWRASDLFHHVISDNGFSLSEAYIWNIIQQAEASPSTPAKQENWPYLSTRSFPAQAYRNDPAISAKLPNTYFTIPGQTSAFYYLKLQAPKLSTVTKYKKALWSIAPTTKPKGLVIYSDQFNYLSVRRIIDDMYYFADNGYYVIFTKGDAIDIADLADWIHTDPEKRNLALYVIAFKEKAAADLKLARTDLRGKFKGMAFVNYQFDDEVQNPHQLKQSGTDCPVLYVFDSTLSGLPDHTLQEIGDYASKPLPKSFNTNFVLIPNPNQAEDFCSQRAMPSIKDLFDSSP